MRNQPARVVLAACLAAVSTAAQAPVSSPHGSPAGIDAVTGERAAAPSGTFAASPSSLFDATIPGASAQGTQEPGGYSMWEVYRKNHGEFMDRMQRYDPQVKIGAAIFPHEKIHNEPGEFDLYQQDLDVKVPVLVSTEGYLIFGAYAKSRRYVFSNSMGSRGNPSGVNLNDETVTGAGARLGVGVFLDDNWLYEMSVDPGVWSDLEGHLKHQDYDFPGQAMFTWRTTPEFFVKMGARYNQTFRDAPWLPLLGFSWEITPSFRVDLLLPEHFELSFWPSSNTGILWGVEVDGAEYRVHTSNGTTRESDNFRVQEVTSYLGWMTRFDERTSLLIRGGVVASGDYSLTTGANGFDRAEGSLNQGFFGEITFGFDF